MFSPQGPSPIYRDFHTATGIDGVMYVWGGREVPSGWYDSPDHEEYGSAMYALDTTTNRWSIVPAAGYVPIGRRSHSACEWRIFTFPSKMCRHNGHRILK